MNKISWSLDITITEGNNSMKIIYWPSCVIFQVIASGVVTSLSDVEAYTSCTLFASSQGVNNSSDLTEPITACIEFLKANQFIRVLKDNQIMPTNLGEACLSAALPPDQALRLLSELHKARQCFVLDSELHIIYQVCMSEYL